MTYRLLQTSNRTDYSTMTTLPNPGRIEISRGSPLVIFGGNEFYNNGFVYYSVDGATFHTLTLLASGVMGQEELAGGELVSDTRNFDIVGSSDIVLNNTIPPSGGTFARLTGIVQHMTYEGESELRVVHYDASPSWQSPPLLEAYVVQGTIDKMETSNYGYRHTPYIFLSTLSGELSEFYQINRDQTTIYNHTNTLPATKILSIRLDDRV